MFPRFTHERRPPAPLDLGPARTAWRNMSTEEKAAVRALARIRQPILARLPDDGWILRNQCLRLIAEEQAEDLWPINNNGSTWGGSFRAPPIRARPSTP